MKIQINKIKIGKRFRKDMGDLDSLMESIQEIDLLHPIVIDENNTLIAGLRRLKAVEKLGWKEVPIHQVSLKSIIKGEQAENIIRKNFTPTEIYAIANALEPIEKTRAKERQNEARKRSGEIPLTIMGRADDKIAQAVGVDRKTLAHIKEIMESKDEKLIEAMDKTNVNRAYRSFKRKEMIENKLSLIVPKEQYRTIVIDPPWPVQKIIRENRPNQDISLDYPVMGIEEIKSLPLEKIAYKDCHVYLWTTHKFLPIAFEIFKEWNVEYECLLTWVKNVGMTPFSWMYSTEFILFGRKGNLELLKKGERLDFSAKVREHSRKPDEFYDLVKKVSPEPRVDIFSREKHEGFFQLKWKQNI